MAWGSAALLGQMASCWRKKRPREGWAGSAGREERKLNMRKEDKVHRSGFDIDFGLLLFAAGSTNGRRRAGLSGGRRRRHASARWLGGGAWRKEAMPRTSVADDGVGARREAELGDDGLGGGVLGGGGRGGQEAEHGSEEERLADGEVGWSTSSCATNPWRANGGQ
uniref:DUF834 domain-containing protein n=1 Tax=Oryza glumipatula TaxID=40148 RepID=A0A0D9Z8A9_9ORYZ